MKSTLKIKFTSESADWIETILKLLLTMGYNMELADEHREYTLVRGE